MRALLLAAALSATATGAYAQERAPADRQTLGALAYSLGEAHALRRLCAGPRDATWYDRMQKLIGVEQADEGLRRRLIESFNSGFVSRQAEFPACNGAVRAAERAAAVHGRVLAQTLARSPDASVSLAYP